MEEMERRGTLLGESLASACTLRYLVGDLETIRYIFYRAGEIQDVNSIALIEPEGKVAIQIGKMTANTGRLKLSGRDEVDLWRDDQWIHVLAPLIIQRQKMEGIADMLSEGVDSNASVTQKEPLLL